MAPARKLPTQSDSVSREVCIVGILTVSAAIVRLWGLPRLGLCHFDEGIYALAGLWSISPGGLASLDRSLIPYAPPGFPFLVGCSYLGLGVSDVAAILVSIAAGTLTVPATAWLARRTGGVGAGAAAAALVAFSGCHVAFSRMALTDVALLLCWTVGLVCGQRFLEHPKFTSSFFLGLSIGLAQWFKYSGWLLGAFVVLAACLGMLVDPRERRRLRVLTTCGLGLLALVIAAVLYWPWFSYVQSHGGYAALMQHHRSYMGGVRSWLPHLRLQLEQAAALSGGPAWSLTASLAAVFAIELTRLRSPRPSRLRTLYPRAFFVILSVFPAIYWLIGVAWVVDPRSWPTPGKRLLALAWTSLSLLTPFYHPYARLWMPLQLLGWIMIANRISEEPAFRPPEPVRPFSPSPVWEVLVHPGIAVIVAFGTLLAVSSLRLDHSRSLTIGPGELPGPLARSDSLRNGVRKIVADLPPGTPGLRLLARPAVTFYLAGRVPVQVEPELKSLVAPAAARLWAVVDLAQLPQGDDRSAATAALLERWELVCGYPSQPDLPTLLDLDPGAARAGTSECLSIPLWLLRPRSRGPAP